MLSTATCGNLEAQIRESAGEGFFFPDFDAQIPPAAIFPVYSNITEVLEKLAVLFADIKYYSFKM